MSQNSKSDQHSETPATEVLAKAQRRQYTAEYKLGVLREADACKAPGEMGALLRREGLYSSFVRNGCKSHQNTGLKSPPNIA